MAGDDERAGPIADESLLQAPPEALPADLGAPPRLPAGPARRSLVGAGVFMTGLTLLVGLALLVVGVIELVSGDGRLGLGSLVIGAVLAGTHWGWVHVAEALDQGGQSRRAIPVLAARQAWLAAIAPYERVEIATRALDDGELVIERIHFVPVPTGPGRFTFRREATVVERHPPDTPAATIAERAELVRRQARRDAEQARARWAATADAQQTAALAAEDEARRQRESAATAQALSDQINARLRDPPLSE